MYQTVCKEHEFVVVEHSNSSTHLVTQCKNCGALQSSTPPPAKESVEGLAKAWLERNGYYHPDSQIYEWVKSAFIAGTAAKAATPAPVSREEGKGEKHVGSNQYCSCGDPSCERFAPVSDAVELCKTQENLLKDAHSLIKVYRLMAPVKDTSMTRHSCDTWLEDYYNLFLTEKQKV